MDSSCIELTEYSTTPVSGEFIVNSNNLVNCGVSNSSEYVLLTYSDYQSLHSGSEMVTLSTDTTDLLITAGLIIGMCICFCIGFLCHEMGAK